MRNLSRSQQRIQQFQWLGATPATTDGDFQKLLGEVDQRIPNLENVALAGLDGLVIAAKRHDEPVELLAIEMADLVKNLSNFGDELAFSPLRQIYREGISWDLLLQMIQPEYFLFALRRPKDAFLARARYELYLKALQCYPHMI